MGHSQSAREASHARIVDIASRRFRMHGLRGIGVADVMKEAGLTVGGFYKHFDSREALVEEAMAAAFTDVEHWSDKAATHLRTAIREYLSEKHRDNLSTSCAAATFLCEVDKHGDEARVVYTERLRRLIGRIAATLPPQENREARATMIFSACAGALALSRAVSDPRLSRELLDTVADQLLRLVPEAP